MDDKPHSLSILHISTPSTFYGGENQAWLLMQGLRRRGHACHLAAPHGSPLLRRAQDDGISAIPLRGNSRSFANLRRVRKWLLSNHVDVIHAHDAHAVDIMGVVGLLKSIKRVATRRCDYPLRSPMKYRHVCHRIISISQYVTQSLVASGFPSSRISEVFSGVVPERTVSGNRERGRRSVGVSDAEPLVLQIGSLLSSKGHQDSIEAIRKVVPRLPDVRVCFAGEGHLRKPLEDTVRHAGLQDAISFLGYRNDIADLLAACDLFIMPSRVEPLGTSVIDAMFAAKPIVCSNAGGIPELVGPWGEQPPVARIVRAGDTDALASEIVSILTNPTDAAKLGNAARLRAEQRFHADHMVEGTLAVYLALLSKSLVVQEGPRRQIG